MNRDKKKVKSSKSSQMDPFKMMPNEILNFFFSFLPLKWKRVARLVSRRWCRILNHHTFILNVQLNDTSITTTKHFTKPHLTSLTVKKFNQDITRVHGPITIPPTITKLIIRNEVPFVYLIKLLHYYACSNINELVLTSFSLTWTGAENIPKLLSSLKHWNNLKILKLCAARRELNLSLCLTDDEFIKHSQAIAKVLEVISLPTLNQLSLHLDSSHLMFPVREKPTLETESIYVNLAKLLQRHQIYSKLIELELKWLGRNYIYHTRYPPELWKGSIAQLESIKLDLKEFNLNYMLRFLNTQKQVKHIELKSFRPDVIDKLLATNSKTLQSISIYGLNNKLSLTSSCYASLKSLTVGFYNMDNFEQFVNRMPSKTSSVFPALVTFYLVDTYFLTRSYQRTHDVYQYESEDRIEDVSRILEGILTTFPDLPKLIFSIRGDSSVSSDISNVDSAVTSILRKVQDLIAKSNVTSIGQYQTSAAGMKLKKKIKLACNLVLNSGKSCKQYYERSVEIKFYKSNSSSLIFYQQSVSAPLF